MISINQSENRPLTERRGQRIYWYDSVNILSSGKAEESVMRLESCEIAGERIDTVTKPAEDIPKATAQGENNG